LRDNTATPVNFSANKVDKFHRSNIAATRRICRALTLPSGNFLKLFLNDDHGQRSTDRPRSSEHLRWTLVPTSMIRLIVCRAAT
jgi:hypothetical protein